jgi:hypothetical protein
VRILAGALVTSALVALSLGGIAQHDLVVAIPGIALAALWGLAMALHWPRGVHSCCLGATSALCALSVILRMPILLPLFSISASLYGWDLALLDLRLQSHPREATFKLARKYAIRGVSLGLAGGGVTLIARYIQVQLSFFTAFAILCLCLVLFLTIHRHSRGVFDDNPSEVKEKRTAKPPASL